MGPFLCLFFILYSSSGTTFVEGGSGPFFLFFGRGFIFLPCGFLRNLCEGGGVGETEGGCGWSFLVDKKGIRNTQTF